MIYLGCIFLSVGLFGIFYVIAGAAFFSLMANIFRIRKTINPTQLNKNLSLEILLAAYNEEKTILDTLKSFEIAINNQSNEYLKVSLFIGLDHCTDNTENLINDFKNKSSVKINYLNNDGNRGKWFVIKKLISESHADWVALTDCGSIWNKQLINEVSKYLNNDEIICISPSYLPINAGGFETCYWRMEQLFRRIENFGSGSVMVHGLTVFYNRKSLLRAIELLGEKHWFNDDVVIPMMLQLDNFKNRTFYLANISPIAWVRDIGIVSDLNIERNRRKRIMIGNLQIITDLIIPNLGFKLVSFTSLRVLFKVLWAYWVSFIFLGLGILILFNPFLINSLKNQSNILIIFEVIFLSIFLLFIVKSNYMHRVLMAYLSGLKIKKGLDELKDTNKISWS